MIYVNVRAIIVKETLTGEEEVLIQRRVKEEETGKPFELPGGRLEKYESLLDCLNRELKEETGLDIERILDPLDKVETVAKDGFKVECMRPFAVYQTIDGPVDSMGVYFRCKAKGCLLEKGDDTAMIGWVNLERLQSLLEQDEFSGVDKAGIEFYLNERNRAHAPSTSCLTQS
ncbi:NUDIX hydrolase [Sporosarcina sp. Te-1]|uniref:NUDIX hydrolase n=1 Tax=Sporosarcina sp. Te-1 TaxID=2818390 RepID=UPI001A9D4304|nr:NUDIX domain-containing protein [Sporosarcina sp. Te-1]QTD42072.1 NUDIX domain-containing protein [Sporosarcina sp. Te-1]